MGLSVDLIKSAKFYQDRVRKNEDLSNELLDILAAQGGAKLPEVTSLRFEKNSDILGSRLLFVK